MKEIFCISGLGADERIFQKLQIPGAELKPLKWITPHPQENIARYAERMSAQVTGNKPIVLGVSFGGMMAVEMAPYLEAATLILISSIKSHAELPRWMKLSGRLKLNALAPARPWKWLRPFENRMLGTENHEEEQLANEFRETIDPAYLKWAISQVLNWRNKSGPPLLYHIHGTSDKTFPIKNIRATHVIQKGGHFMVMNRANEISDIISKIIINPANCQS